MEKIENSNEVAIRRNSKLLKMFNDIGIYDIRLIGDINKPAIIYQDKLVLSAYVRNFELKFTNKPSNGEVIRVVKLNSELDLTFEEFNTLYHKYEHRDIFKIKGDQGLYLIGWNYINPLDKSSIFPVFAKHNPKIYFSLETALEKIELLKSMNYETTLE